MNVSPSLKLILDNHVEKFSPLIEDKSKIENIDFTLLQQRLNDLLALAREESNYDISLESEIFDDFPGVLRPRGDWFIFPGDSEEGYTNDGDTVVLVIYARQGGGNDECYCDSDDFDTHDSACLYANNEKIRFHSAHITDHYDSFDETYITFYLDTGLSKEEFQVIESKVNENNRRNYKIESATTLRDYILTDIIPVWVLLSDKGHKHINELAHRYIACKKESIVEDGNSITKQEIENTRILVAHMNTVVDLIFQINQPDNDDDNDHTDKMLAACEQLITLCKQPLPAISKTYAQNLGSSVTEVEQDITSAISSVALSAATIMDFKELEEVAMKSIEGDKDKIQRVLSHGFLFDSKIGNLKDDMHTKMLKLSRLFSSFELEQIFKKAEEENALALEKHTAFVSVQNELLNTGL